MPAPDRWPFGVELPPVSASPQGADQIEAWRDRQLLNLVVAWALPIALGFAGLILERLAMRSAAGLAALGGGITAAIAPGLTVVFLLRRNKASRLAATLPRMPRAVVRPAQRRMDDSR